MLGNFGNGVLAVEISLFIKIKIFGAFFELRPLYLLAVFGGLIMGVSGKETISAVSDPMSIVSKGVHIIAPIYNELFKTHGVMDLISKICFFSIALQITLAYLEFYIAMVTGYMIFFLSGLKQTRK